MSVTATRLPHRRRPRGPLASGSRSSSPQAFRRPGYRAPTIRARKTDVVDAVSPRTPRWGGRTVVASRLFCCHPCVQPIDKPPGRVLYLAHHQPGMRMLVLSRSSPRKTPGTTLVPGRVNQHLRSSLSSKSRACPDPQRSPRLIAWRRDRTRDLSSTVRDHGIGGRGGAGEPRARQWAWRTSSFLAN